MKRPLPKRTTFPERLALLYLRNLHQEKKITEMGANAWRNGRAMGFKDALRLQLGHGKPCPEDRLEAYILDITNEVRQQPLWADFITQE